MSDSAVFPRALPVNVSTGDSRPLALGQVMLSPEGYWGRWQEVNGQQIIWHCLKWIEKSGWLKNFWHSAQGNLPEHREGRVFTDADVYKLLEALSWEYARTQSAFVDERIREIAAIIARAQEPDGYLNTSFGRRGQEPRYTDLEWGHELYNYGHLLQAAVARLRSVGEDELVSVARRAADHLCEVFGEDGIQSVCGHPGVETALVEFARETGDSRYLRQAQIFIDRRGQGSLGEIEFGQSYFQDDEPIRDATAFAGHAVRAMYLAAGATDVAVENGDRELLEAVQRQWNQTMATRTYITAGMGSRHQDEAIGEDFELPNDRAYCETCAGVGLVMLDWRMLLETGDVRYADSMERALHNIVATSPSEAGDAFFYANTLHQREAGVEPHPDEVMPRASSSQRAPWFEVSCCPNNIARLFASINGYVASISGNTLNIHLLTSGTVFADTEAGHVEANVETSYPHESSIHITIPKAAPGSNLRVRIPAWATAATVARDGERRVAEPGFVQFDDLRSGEKIEIDLSNEARFIWPSPRVDSIRGCIAVEKGPLVYCLQILAADGISVNDFRINSEKPPVVREGNVFVSGWIIDSNEKHGLYSNEPYAERLGEEREFQLIPYSDWGELGPSTMRVWFPIAQTARS